MTARAPAAGRLALAALVTLAAVLRLVALDADPPTSFGAAHLTDEGYYAKNAREWVRSGRWTRPDDNHNHVFLAPVTVAANAVAFRLVGPSLTSARTVTAIALTLGIAALALALGRREGSAAALFAAALLALDPGLVALGRVALAEGLLLLASALFVLAVARDIRRAGAPVLTWLAFAFALGVKASAISLFAVAAVALVLDGASRRAGRGGVARAAVVIAGMLALVAAWRWLWVAATPAGQFMYDYELGVHLVEEGRWRALDALQRSFVTKHATRPFAFDPLLGGLAAMALAVVVADAARGRALDALEAAAAGWLVGTAAFFSAAPYQPPRYFLVLAAPAALLVARQLADPARWWARARSSLPATLAVLVGSGGVAIALAVRAAGVTERLLCVAVGLVAAAVLAALLVRGRRLAALALVLLVPLVTLWRWGSSLERSVAATVADVNARVGAGDVVVGYFADTFTLAGAARPLVVHGPWNPGPLDERGVTHLLVRGEELRWLLDREPALQARLQRQAAYAPQAGVRGTLVLYRLAPAGPATQR